jgi:hypothetical protein
MAALQKKLSFQMERNGTKLATRYLNKLVTEESNGQVIFIL